MAEVSIDLNMVRVSNEEFLKKAADCAPQLKETLVRPVEIVDIRENDGVYPEVLHSCLLYTSPSPRDRSVSRMPSSA